MTAQEAYQILGIPWKAGKREIKKRYRQLMMQVHPDAGRTSQEGYGYSAQEINIAYAVLMKGKWENEGDISQGGKPHTTEKKKKAAWDAPINARAFAEREVLQYVEDYEGTILGNYCVAKGKYLWKTDEDFPLFLLSLFKCSKELLDEIDEKFHENEAPLNRQQVQAELTYLLAQQFIDGLALLEELAKEEKIGSDEEKIYYLSSMLEFRGEAVPVKVGEAVYPSRIKNHKLYLKNQSGKEVGYLSFLDDRLYYIIIPLFEQKRVQVKLQVAEKNVEKSRKKTIWYQNLHLWIKLPKKNRNCMPENLNLQIEELLAKYKQKRV